MWPLQLLALTEAGFRVVRYDVRGHGRTSTPDRGYDWATYAEDLRALLDGLEIGRTHIAGFSMGGGIAITFALENPGRVRSLALLDPVVPGFAYSARFAAGMEELTRTVRAEGWRAAAERRWLSHPMFAGLRAHPARFQVIRDIVLDFSAREYLVDQPETDDATAPGGAAPEAIDRLETLRPPALVIVGERDLPDFLMQARVIDERAPRTKLEIIADCGHMTPLERPGDVNRLLLAFLADPAGATEPPAPTIAVRPATTTDLPAIERISGTFSTARVLRLERRGRAPELTFDFTIHDATAGPEPGAGPSSLFMRVAGSPLDMLVDDDIPIRPAGGGSRGPNAAQSSTPPDTAERAEPRPPYFWRDRLEHGDHVLVVTVDGEIAGAAALCPWDHGPALRIADLRVLPDARRNGLGRALVDAAAVVARAAGLRAIRTIIPNDNVDGAAFLLTCGFRFSGFDDRLDAGHRPAGNGQSAPAALFFTYALPPAEPASATLE